MVGINVQMRSTCDTFEETIECIHVSSVIKVQNLAGQVRGAGRTKGAITWPKSVWLSIYKAAMPVHERLFFIRGNYNNEWDNKVSIAWPSAFLDVDGVPCGASNTSSSRTGQHTTAAYHNKEFHSER